MNRGDPWGARTWEGTCHPGRPCRLGYGTNQAGHPRTTSAPYHLHQTTKLPQYLFARESFLVILLYHGAPLTVEWRHEAPFDGRIPPWSHPLRLSCSGAVTSSSAPPPGDGCVTVTAHEYACWFCRQSTLAGWGGPMVVRLGIKGTPARDDPSCVSLRGAHGLPIGPTNQSTHHRTRTNCILWSDTGCRVECWASCRQTVKTLRAPHHFLLRPREE